MTSRRARQSDFARAVECGDVETVRRMIADGADVAYIDEHNNTPLGLAHLHRRGTIARMLIAAGALPMVVAAEGFTVVDVKRLLARHKRMVASLKIPTDAPDPTLATVLRRGRIAGERLTLVLDERPLPPAAATRRAVLEALGYEALRWLKQQKIATQGEFFVGTAQPWYTVLPRSVPRARRVLAMIGR